jgi:hypothetical protein
MRKVGAISALRREPSGGSDVKDCWHRSPMFSATLHRVGGNGSVLTVTYIRAISGLVARIRSDRASEEVGFPRREAEDLVRASLGKCFFEEANPAQMSYPEIGIAALDRLFREWRPCQAEADAPLDRVSAILTAA